MAQSLPLTQDAVSLTPKHVNIGWITAGQCDWKRTTKHPSADNNSLHDNIIRFHYLSMLPDPVSMILWVIPISFASRAVQALKRS